MLRWGIILGCSLFCSVFAAPGDVDVTFKPKLPTDFAVTIVFELGDGRLLVGGNSSAVTSDGFYTYFLLRLHANGRLDRAFQPTRGRARLIGPVLDITERSDGTIGAIGQFVTGRKESAPRSAFAVKHNGRLTSFTPATNFYGGAWLPNGGIVFDATITRDFFYGLAPWFGQLGTLNEDGHGLAVARLPYRGARFHWLKAFPDGHVLAILATTPAGAGSMYHLFYSSQWGELRFEWNYGYPMPSVIPGPSNTLYVATFHDGPATGIVRYGANWQRDESFLFEFPSAITGSGTNKLSCLTSQADGRLVYAARAATEATNYLFRCQTTGAHDPTFQVMPLNAAVHGLFTLRNGQILVWGDFTELNGIPVQKLVRLNTN